MKDEEKVYEILKRLVDNASKLKMSVSAGDLGGSAKLTGHRVALIEALRELHDAKVSLTNSDKIDEMNILFKNAEKYVFDAVGAINVRLSELRKELTSTEGARKIAAYAAMGHSVHRSSKNGERDKIQGGRNGY